jgi:DNA-binding transcriptional ArsR family regulator
MAADCAVVESTDQAATLMDPVRLRILALLREPESAAGVARALQLPRQRVGYHIRALQEAQLLRSVGERRRGNCVEHLLQATASFYVVGPRALGAAGALHADPGTVRDRFSSGYLIAAASRTIAAVGALRERAAAAGRQLPTLTLEAGVRFASPEDQRAFADELMDSFAALVAKYHDDQAPRGRRFRVVISGHPALPPDNAAVAREQPAPVAATDTRASFK